MKSSLSVPFLQLEEVKVHVVVGSTLDEVEIPFYAK